MMPNSLAKNVQDTNLLKDKQPEFGAQELQPLQHKCTNTYMVSGVDIPVHTTKFRFVPIKVKK